MADVAELWQPEAEDVAEAGLKPIATVNTLANYGFEALVNPKEGANGNGLDHNGDTNVSDILDFDDIGANNGGESGVSQVETRETKHVGEVVEEEIVELEFEKVKTKLATHSMHCPNCDSEIKKVTLRRKVLVSRPNPVVPEPEPESELKPDSDPKNLVGCFSCLSLFTCSENGCFNPFDIFRKTPETTISPVSPPSTGGTENKESCLSMFWVIRKGKSNPNPDDPPQSETLDVNPRSLSFDPPQSPSSETMINIGNETETVVDAQSRGRPWLGNEGVLVEILKSIVYGGLMEIIASLSVVASATSSNASTLSIISLALASLIGGAFVIGHNIWDLRDDCYKDSSNNEATNKYKELLGQVNYFPLHAFFAILSFLVFGVVPPVAYGFSFHETNDKDDTIVTVAIASLLCVSLLAIFKAYINRCTVLEYFKTVTYYITTAVCVSGVSYVVGNLVTRLMEKYGLFDTSSSGGMSLIAHTTVSALQSF